MKFCFALKQALRATLCILAVTPSVFAEDPLSLLDIMRALNADTLELTTALMTEDRASMQRAATAIADHPKVPMNERLKILSRLGVEGSTFRSLDTQVHDAAVGIAKAAQAGDLATAAQQYQVMINGCMSCHTAFRARIRNLRLGVTEQQNRTDD